MPQYRVLIERTRTVVEYQAVILTASSKVYAERDAKVIADPFEWKQESEITVCEVQHVKEMGPKKPEGGRNPAKFSTTG